MRRRLLAFCLALVAPIACVDLFHSTDFVTLCERDPNSPSCGGEGGADAAPPPDAADEDASPKPVDFCAWTPAEARKRAAHACAWLGACEGPLDGSRFGSCMMQAIWAYDCDFNPTMRPNGATHALWACLAEAKSCAEVDACVYGGAVTVCNAVQGGSFTACGTAGAANVRVQCGRPEQGRPTSAEPCALAGRSCERLDDSVSACTGTKKKACSVGRSCAGTAAVDCEESGGVTVDRGLDCAAFGGGACVEKNGNVACAPQADAGTCARDTLDVRCVSDGGAASSCVDNKEIVVDCTKLLLTCDVTTAPVPAYEPFKACVMKDGPCAAANTDECGGTMLNSCAQGRPFVIDCASVGLGPCEKNAGDGLARCSPPR